MCPGEYIDGTPVLVLKDNGLPVAKLTVCMHPVVPDEGNVFIKSWAENEGVLAALIQAGVVEPLPTQTRAGFAQATECKLLVSLEDLLEKD